jgi:hypothetical protein
MTHRSLRLRPLAYAVQKKRGAAGRLIRASRYRGDPEARAYLVAVPDRATAIDLITANAAEPGYEIEDLGRVSEDLIAAMTLPPGKFVSVDEVHHAAQKKPRSPTEKNE